MDPHAGGWHYNKNSDPPLHWDTSRDAIKYFRVVRWIDTIAANRYSPNEKDPSESPPIFVLPNGSLPPASSASASTSADTAPPPAGTQLPRQLRYFEIRGDDEDDEAPAGYGGRADDRQGWNAQLPDTTPAPGGHSKKLQTVWTGSKSFKAKGNFYELRVEKVLAGRGGVGGREASGSLVGSGAQQGVPAVGYAYGNRSTTESFAEVASRAEGAAAAGRNGGGSGGGGSVYTFSPRGRSGGMRGAGRGRGIGGGGGGRGGGVYRRDGLL